MKDEKSGFAGVKLFVAILCVVTVCTISGYAATLWNIRNADNTSDLAKIEDNGDLTVTGKVAATAGYGNIALTDMTNAVKNLTGTLITNTTIAATGKTNTYVFVPFGDKYILKSITTSP